MGSEYGLQSLPSYETLEPVYEDADMDYWGDLSEWRQHHPFGKIEYRDLFCSIFICYYTIQNAMAECINCKDGFLVPQLANLAHKEMSSLSIKRSSVILLYISWMIMDFYKHKTFPLKVWHKSDIQKKIIGFQNIYQLQLSRQHLAKGQI